MTPATILRLTQQYVPEFYRSGKEFKDSKEFLENNEWGLALDSLIEMANESGHFAEVVKDKLAGERHQKDMLNELLTHNGFHLKPQGRVGTIYYIDNGKVLEIGYEISGVPQYDLLPYFDNIETWAIPNGEPVHPKQKVEIRQQLIAWLKTKGIKTDLT